MSAAAHCGYGSADELSKRLAAFEDTGELVVQLLAELNQGDGLRREDLVVTRSAVLLLAMYGCWHWPAASQMQTATTRNIRHEQHDRQHHRARALPTQGSAVAALMRHIKFRQGDTFMEPCRAEGTSMTPSHYLMVRRWAGSAMAVTTWTGTLAASSTSSSPTRRFPSPRNS